MPYLLREAGSYPKCAQIPLPKRTQDQETVCEWPEGSHCLLPSACARRCHPRLESEAVLFPVSPMLSRALAFRLPLALVTTYWRPAMALCSNTDILDPKLSLATTESYRQPALQAPPRQQMCSVRGSASRAQGPPGRLRTCLCPAPFGI